MKDDGTGRPADDYERRFMAGGGRPLHREKMVWRLHWILGIWVPFLWVLAGIMLAGVGSKPAPPVMALLPLGMSVLFAALWALFAVLRVHVTDQEVHVQYGLWGPRIPVSAIESCEVVDYELSKFGGWGIRRSLDGTWAYSLMGDSGKVVQIAWRHEGKTKKVVVSSPDPAALAAKIQQARAKADQSVRARVEAVSAEGAEIVEAGGAGQEPAERDQAG
jgi:hypothetical protein